MTALSDPQRWVWAQVDAEFRMVAPPEPLVQSVHMIAINADVPTDILVCRARGQHLFELPGGTREPGESVLECLRREMQEEAGVVLDEIPVVAGAHWARGYHHIPYRPHLPHPFKAWLWCVGRVQIVGAPTNPDSGEHIEEVRSVGVDGAAALLCDREAWYPELINLALRRYRAVGESTVSVDRIEGGSTDARYFS